MRLDLVQDAHGLDKVKISGKDTHIVEGLVRAAELIKDKDLNIVCHTF